jgi:eukaryotic-like serine/threonine-protein kinase
VSPAATPVSLGRYVIHGELASGGMAAVFYARLMGPSGFARTVAVKRPHAHLLNDRAFAMMLIDEARVASRIRHPNVVSTLDIIETPTALALVMEYVHGESLGRLSSAARAHGERVPLPIAAAILIDALHGMHAAHEATDEQSQPLNIVHRDISPQNLLVGADGITRIADFGIAKAAGRLLTTRDGAVKGKFAYMAPEQIRGHAVTRQTDIFAASIVLWELLTSESLFRGANQGEEIYKCLEGVVEAPSKRDNRVPPAFDAIVLRGLARDMSARYPTAREMAADLERAAPAVRPSEIGAWVERLAGGTLAARAAVIAEMERSASGAEGAGSGSAGLPLMIAPASESSGISARAPRGEQSQVSHAGVVAERLPPPSTSSRLGRRLAFGAVGGLLITLASGALWVYRGSPARAEADAAPPPVLFAPSAPPPLSPLPLTPPAAPLAPTTSAAPTPPLAPTASAAPSASTKPSPHTPVKRAPAGCDPPYIVDAQGREVFKLQCL